MTAYYNEIEPKAAAALRALIEDGLIAPGDIDTRPIQEVQPDDLKGYTQCHFFAGIGLWSVALRWAGWCDDRPVWTGSCPCQPFSVAGKRTGKKDDRHLWPEWHRLIREHRPPILFGEQVSSAIAHGWLDELADDLEGQGYAIGSAEIPACSAGAFHKRERLWFVAHHHTERRQYEQAITGSPATRMEPDGPRAEPCALRDDGALADRRCNEYGRRDSIPCATGEAAAAAPENQGSHRTRGSQIRQRPVDESADGSARNGIALADTHLAGFSAWRCSTLGEPGAQSQPERCGAVGEQGAMANPLGQRGCGWHAEGQDAAHADPSSEGDSILWLPCPDGKHRAIKSGIRLLVDGFPARIPLLRAAGNAIDPRPAAQFILAAREALNI